MTLVWLSNLIATVSPLFCCRAICCAEVFTPRTIPATWVPPPPPSTPPRISPSVPACAHAPTASSVAAAAAVRVICRIDDISHLLLDSDESAIPVPATRVRAGSTPTTPMTALDHIRRLWKHASWADDVLLVAVKKIPLAKASAAVREYAHVLGAEEVWLARIEAREPTLPVWPETQRNDLGAVARAVHAAYDKYLGALRDADLERGVPYKNSLGR